MGDSYINKSPVASPFPPVAPRADKPMSLGWASKSTRKSKGLLENFKVSINKIFMEGKETGRKANPSYEASKFKTLQTATGEIMFVMEE